MRFRSKSYLYFDPDGQNPQRGLVVAIDAANAPVGECGVENQVGRVGVTFGSIEYLLPKPMPLVRPLSLKQLRTIARCEF